jgi:hypothetical protein
MKEPVNDLPVDEWEHGEVVRYYAITVPVTKSVAYTVRTLKRAVCQSFEQIIIVSEEEPHFHCHALVGGSVTEADLETFGRKISAIEGSWHEALKTETAVMHYRDYILAINRHENKGVGTNPAYFRNAEAFFLPFPSLRVSCSSPKETNGIQTRPRMAVLDTILPNEKRENHMKNTILTERQEQWGKISGTPQDYIDKKYKQTWLAIVEQFTAGCDLTEDQAAFIERTNKYACTARGGAVRLKRADFASARLPRKIRG